MKYILIAFMAVGLCSCIAKSEEAIVLKIDTASMIKGRTVHADISVINSSESEYVAKVR